MPWDKTKITETDNSYIVFVLFFDLSIIAFFKKMKTIDLIANSVLLAQHDNKMSIRTLKRIYLESINK